MSRRSASGVAALEVLAALGVSDNADKPIVRGENIAQAYQFVSSGNADLGFIALSQLTGDNEARPGMTWIVPHELYNPIRQDAVLLRKGIDNPAAQALLDFLQSEPALRVIEQFGYRSQITLAAAD